jgi:cullin 3
VLHKHGELLYSGVVETVRHRLQRLADEVRRAADELLLPRLREAWETHQREMRNVRDILMYMDRTFVPQTRKLPIYEQGTLLFRAVVARHADVKPRAQRLLLAAVDDARRGRPVDLQLLRGTLAMLVELGVGSTSVYAEDFELRFVQDTAQFFHDESAAVLEQSTAPDYLRHAERRLEQEMERGAAFLHHSTLPRLKQLLERALVADHVGALLEMEGSGLVPLLERDARDDLARMYALFARYKQPVAWTWSGAAGVAAAQGGARADSAAPAAGVAGSGLGVDFDATGERSASKDGDELPGGAGKGSGSSSAESGALSAEAGLIAVDGAVGGGDGGSGAGGAGAGSSFRAQSASSSSTMVVAGGGPPIVTRQLRPLDCMRELLKSHVLAQGRGIVNDDELRKDPVRYVEKLIALRQKYSDIVWRSFANDKDFQRTLKEAFEVFLNAPHDRRPPEFLSLYLDDQMRGGFKGRSEDEMNGALNAAVTLFRFLHNKDEFEEWYKTHLQKRLLGNKTAADDAERLMIVKLKSECGFQFTSKLEGMFNDVSAEERLRGGVGDVASFRNLTHSSLSPLSSTSRS